MKKNHLQCGLLIIMAALAACGSTKAQTNAPDTAALSLSQQAHDQLEQATSTADYLQAATLYEQAVKADPYDYEDRVTLGWIYLDKLHDPAAAYPYLDMVVQHRPDDLNARKLLGQACMDTGRNRKAVEQFRKASQLAPNDLWIKASLGRSLAREGNYGGASRLFDEVLRADPKNFDARLGRAEVAAWEGQSETALEILRELKAENPTDAEVLTLMGDIHRWQWKLAEARQDYHEALAVDTNNAAAKAGLRDAEWAGSSEVGANGYYFKDTTGFRRESVGADTRIHLTDQAYLIGSVAGWRFTAPGFDNIDRIDGSAGADYHWARWLDTSLQGNVYDYEHRNDVWGGQFASKITPMNGFDIYTTLAGRQPFISSIATVTNALRQNIIGNGLDIHVYGPVSVQNDLQVAHISDGNDWWEDKPQLSVKVFDQPATFLRVQYDHLSFSHTNLTYWSPHNYNVVSPIVDTTIPIFHGISLALDGQAPYVIEARSWGYIFNGGPVINLFNCCEIKASYYKSSIPGDQGVWSGQGGQASITFRF